MGDNTKGAQVASSLLCIVANSIVANTRYYSTTAECFSVYVYMTECAGIPLPHTHRMASFLTFRKTSEIC